MMQKKALDLQIVRPEDNLKLDHSQIRHQPTNEFYVRVIIESEVWPIVMQLKKKT